MIWWSSSRLHLDKCAHYACPIPIEHQLTIVMSIICYWNMNLHWELLTVKHRTHSCLSRTVADSSNRHYVSHCVGCCTTTATVSLSMPLSNLTIPLNKYSTFKLGRPPTLSDLHLYWHSDDDEVETVNYHSTISSHQTELNATNNTFNDLFSCYDVVLSRKERTFGREVWASNTS